MREARDNASTRSAGRLGAQRDLPMLGRKNSGSEFSVQNEQRLPRSSETCD